MHVGSCTLTNAVETTPITTLLLVRRGVEVTLLHRAACMTGRWAAYPSSSAISRITTVRFSLRARPEEVFLCQRGSAGRPAKRRFKPPLCDNDEVIVGWKLNIPIFRAMKRNSVVKNDLNNTLKALLGMEALQHLFYKHANLVTACGLWPLGSVNLRGSPSVPENTHRAPLFE